MEYSAWHSVIQDGNGAVVPMAKITVRSTSTGALAKLYSARDGSAPKANPFNADENGQVFFFVAGGAYTIKAEFGTQERTWPFVPVGTAAEYDIDSLALYLNSGVVYFQKYAELGTYVPLSYPAAAVVLADPDALKNGYYTNSGTGWVFGRALQDTISRLFITGGAVNTPTANVGQGINPSAPLVFYVDVTAPNTASVTLNVVGLGQGVVLNAAGNPLAAGEWLGRVMLTREADGRYRIMNDPASALSAAQSATASDTARAASVTAKNQSESAKDQSVTAKNQSEAAKGVSETARDQSVTAKNQSEAARDQSVTAKNKAVAASDSSGQSAVAAAISENNAASSASAASGSASSASTSKNQAASSATTSTNEADRSKREADRAEAAAGGLINAVQFVPQTLTAPQQQQARTNIGAQPVNVSTVGAALATPTPSETIGDGDRLSGLDPSGTGLKLFRFSAVKAWIQGWLTKAMVGLGNADNTSDANKPVSTAQQTALNGKLDVTAQAADSAKLNGKTEAGLVANGPIADALTTFLNVKPGNERTQFLFEGAYYGPKGGRPTFNFKSSSLCAGRVRIKAEYCVEFGDKSMNIRIVVNGTDVFNEQKWGTGNNWLPVEYDFDIPFVGSVVEIIYNNWGTNQTQDRAGIRRLELFLIKPIGFIFDKKFVDPA